MGIEAPRAACRLREDVYRSRLDSAAQRLHGRNYICTGRLANLAMHVLRL